MFYCYEVAVGIVRAVMQTEIEAERIRARFQKVQLSSNHNLAVLIESRHKIRAEARERLEVIKRAKEEKTSRENYLKNASNQKNQKIQADKMNQKLKNIGKYEQVEIQEALKVQREIIAMKAKMEEKRANVIDHVLIQKTKQCTLTSMNIEESGESLKQSDKKLFSKYPQFYELFFNNCEFLLNELKKRSCIYLIRFYLLLWKSKIDCLGYWEKKACVCVFLFFQLK